MGLEKYHNIHKGETCLIIGNGTSLNKTPLDKFKYPSFGSNMIFRFPFTPTYYCMIDKEMCDAISPYKFDINEAFIRAEYAHLWNANPIYPVVVNGFSIDINNFVVMGGTVTYAMFQIAFYMGFKRMLMVGVDHYYPKSSQYGRKRFIADGDDPDHFIPKDGTAYFEKGRVYNPPELDGTTRYYGIAKELFDQAGVECINLTPGTKLDVFRKDKMENWYGR